MSGLHRPFPAGNPFSTRYVRPGALAYRFPPGEDVDSLAARLEQHGWWAQILGGHGAGKSTLLATLIPAIQKSGRKTLLVQLHDGQRRLPADSRAAIKTEAIDLVIVDGYEQLGQLARRSLRRLCRRRRLGLLVTAHRPVGFPTLFHTSADLSTTLLLVAALTEGCPVRIPPEDVEECYRRQHGNPREVFFELYDRYERQRRDIPQGSDNPCDRDEREL